MSLTTHRWRTCRVETISMQKTVRLGLENKVSWSFKQSLLMKWLVFRGNVSQLPFHSKNMTHIMLYSNLVSEKLSDSIFAMSQLCCPLVHPVEKKLRRNIWTVIIEKKDHLLKPNLLKSRHLVIVCPTWTWMMRHSSAKPIWSFNAFDHWWSPRETSSSSKCSRRAVVLCGHSIVNCACSSIMFLAGSLNT